MTPLPRHTLIPLLLALALPLAAQQHAPEAPPVNTLADQPPVLFDVVVTDKKNNPVPNLTQQDFSVTDNHQPSPILAFRPHNIATLPPGDVDPSTQVLFILDETNTSYERVIYARQQLQRYLRRHEGKLLHPVLVGIFPYTGLQLQTQPTVDGNALADALENQGQNYSILSKESERTDRSLDALYSIINTFKDKPGRKMVIWISPGWPLMSGPNSVLLPKQQQYIFDKVTALSAALRLARITLYSIDPRGENSTGERSVYYQNFTRPLTRPDDAYFGDLGLQVLVEQTGGRAIFGDELLEQSLARCVADLDAFYTLAIKPRPADHPNQFHAIDVQVAPPNLKTRTRNGYYAQP